jgi:hypothetical protein
LIYPENGWRLNLIMSPKKMLSGTINSMYVSIFYYEDSNFLKKIASGCALVFDDDSGNFRSVYLFRVEMNDEINAEKSSDIFCENI